jgi:DNA-binding response OmpR family regulator
VLLVADRTRTSDLTEEDGFDDFLLSPIDTTELAVRLRRLSGAPTEDVGDEVVRYRDLELNTATYQASVASHPRDLTYMEQAFARIATQPNGGSGI